MDIEYNNIYSYIVESKARVIVAYGGRDGGKSYFVGGQYFPLMMMQKEYFRGMVVKKTYTSCKDSVFEEITDGITTMKQDHNFNSIKSPLEVRCNNGNKTIFRGLDNPTNLKSIKGLNYI
jgi:phage terminase large subunit